MKNYEIVISVSGEIRVDIRANSKAEAKKIAKRLEDELYIDPKLWPKSATEVDEVLGQELVSIEERES